MTANLKPDQSIAERQRYIYIYIYIYIYRERERERERDRLRDHSVVTSPCYSY